MRKTIQALIEAALISYLPIAFIYSDFNTANWPISGRDISVSIYMFLMFLYALKEVDDSTKRTK